MKKSFRYIFSLVLAVVLGSCTGDFDEINTDPTKSSPDNFDPNYFLSSAQWNHLTGIMGYSGPILFQSGWVQILASTSTSGANYYSNMDKYVPSTNTNSYLASTWNNCYRAASLANEAIKRTEDVPDMINVHAAATIIKILSIQVITDTYGDAPYTEALKASEAVTQPVYDSQETLYPMLLSDLEAAINSFDDSKAEPTSDIFPYKGNLAQWRKFGYSVMLRMAMRLVNASPATAKAYAEKADAGGTLESVADDAYVIGDVSNYTNGNATALITAADFYEVRWSKTFMEFLQNTNDPRVGIVAEVPQDGIEASQNTALAGNDDPAVQLGMPNGFDLNGKTTDISLSPGYPGGTGSGDDFSAIGKYSRPKTSLYGQKNAPFFVITYAQTELLLAEAKVRNFTIDGSAAEHYHNGVKGALLGLAPLGGGAVISEATATNFADASPLDETTTDASLEMINTQYWATTGAFMDFSEAWSNWRRSGYPVLTPVVYASNFSNGTIPVRQPYPTTEPTLNPQNYKDAVGRMAGADNWVTKVWWDQ